MHLAFQYGVDHIWIVNVGDIKPLEFPIQFFLDYAWSPDRLPADSLQAYTRQWVARQFGPQHSGIIASILTDYALYNGRRKPELLSPDTYSLLHYQEAETIAADYNRLAGIADSVYRLLPPSCKDAYYQLVLYPVLACANLNELYVTAARNRLYAAQGRSMTNDLATKARQLFANDSLLSSYYNKQMAGGKWDHMMDQTHIGYTYWQQPPVNAIPELRTLDLSARNTPPPGSAAPAWGIAIEGSASWWPKDTGQAILPTFDPLRRQPHYIEVFNRGTTPFNYSIQTTSPWITTASPTGRIDKQERIWINIDWTKTPAGRQRTPITITGPAGRQITLIVATDNISMPLPSTQREFIETDGYVSIEAEHFDKASPQWLRIPGLGRTLSAMESNPLTAPAQSPGGNSARLEYAIRLFDTGTINVHAFLSPHLPFNDKPLHYAISFDDETPQTIDITTGVDKGAGWEKMVADNIRTIISRHHITAPGRHILKFWMVDPGVVLQKLVIDAGGMQPSYLGPPESYYTGGPRITSTSLHTTDTTGKGLKDYYQNYFPIGVAVSPRSLNGPDTTLILRQFNSLTPENAMKMGPIHPQQDRYYWKDADLIVNFAQAHGLRVRGHNLCWHEQTPAWFFTDSLGRQVSKETLLQRLKDHIMTVVGRYKGRVYAWDVVNEAIDDDSAHLLRNSLWYKICGDEFITKAFEYAHQADPNAQLFYNDYNTERPEKRERVYTLLKQLKTAGVPVTGVGLQAHWSLDEPSTTQLQQTIERFSSLGLNVQITELDVSIYPWEKKPRPKRPNESDELTPDLASRQADQYNKIFSILRDNKLKVSGVTFWNLTDKHSWLDEYPVPGRKNYPLLFDATGQPKKAYLDVTNF
jgi:GH35 family endo-1,4-beta-xylanase